jgi:hypothetical protein
LKHQERRRQQLYDQIAPRSPHCSPAKSTR